MADILVSLTQEERDKLNRVVQLAVGRPLHREWRLNLLIDMLTRLECDEWVVSGMRKQGAQQVVLNLANGKLSSVELKMKI